MRGNRESHIRTACRRRVTNCFWGSELEGCLLGGRWALHQEAVCATRLPIIPKPPTRVI